MTENPDWSQLFAGLQSVDDVLSAFADPEADPTPPPTPRPAEGGR